MSTHLPFPTDEQSAEQVLMSFSELAHNSAHQNLFLAAANILFGPSIVIKEDFSHRMTFKCLVCSKEVNNVRGITDHTKSGTHLKNVNVEIQEKRRYLKSENTSYHPNSLQYKLLYYSVPVLGLQKVEAYLNRGRYYYKCNLCCAHGKIDVMYNHLIGDKHTDKYIKATIILKGSSLNKEERNYLRKAIYEKENFGVEYIKTIKGEEYYPYMWEDMKSRSRKRNNLKTVRTVISDDDVKCKEECYRDKTNMKSSSDGYENHMQISSKSPKEEKKSDEEMKFIQHNDNKGISCGSGSDEKNTQILRNKLKKKNTKIDKSHKGIQVYSLGYWESILMKFNYVVQTHLKEESEVFSIEDLKVALNIVIFALHTLWFINREQLARGGVAHRDSEHLQEQKAVLESCLGYVMKIMAKHFEKNYGTLQFM